MNGTHPDLLQRFVPAPYACVLPHRHGETMVESNSEAHIAALLENAPQLEAVASLRIILDYSVLEDSDTLTSVRSDRVQTLLRGTTTILVFDRDSRELLVFVAPEVSCAELVNCLIPAVLSEAQVRELQTHDIGTIAP